MSQVFMHCPNTGKAVYVGLNMEWLQLDSLEETDQVQQIEKCPHCGENHSFVKDDLFLRSDGAG